MLWSDLPEKPHAFPKAVAAHYRMEKYLSASEGDLRGWRFPLALELKAMDERHGPPSLAALDLRRGYLEAIEEIDRVLRWMRNQDWPFR